MIEFMNTTPRIRIELGTGVYKFFGEAATGKSRLCGLLRTLNKTQPVDAVSYSDCERLPLVLGNKDKKLVVLDRFDMYSDMCHEQIEEFGHRGTIILDMKYSVPGLDVTCCDIYLDRDLVVVK